MTKSLSFALSVIVATALAVPTTAAAQAARRGGSDSGGSSGSAGSRSGGSDSGGSVAVPRHSPPPAPAPAPSGGGDSRVVGRPAGSRPAGSGARVAPGSRQSVEADAAARRVRTTQGLRGQAQPRGDVPLPRPSYPGYWNPGYYYPRHYYSPWSYYYGPGAYSPWIYGGWSWYSYGWYDPFLYDPYGYGGVPYRWTSATRTYDDRDAGAATGSLRLRVNPSSARVYVDGALAGVADEFGGLSNHLSLPEGRHELEFRADGYETVTKEVTVKAGRTQTERVKLQEE